MLCPQLRCGQAKQKRKQDWCPGRSWETGLSSPEAEMCEASSEHAERGQDGNQELFTELLLLRQSQSSE